MTSTASVESTFRPAFEEIARRSSACGDGNEVTHFPRTAHPVRTPFPMPGQDHVLLSMGTQVLAPRTLDPAKPLLRVVGAFEDRQDAVDHAQVLMQLDKNCSVVVARLNAWLLMPQSDSVRDDPEANARRREELVAAHERAREERDAEFDECVRERRSFPPSTMERADDVDQEEAEAEEIVYGRPKRLGAGAEVRGQRFVALCVVPHEAGECLVKILGLFDSSAEADEWAQDVASRAVIHDNILIAPACEWLCPNDTLKGGVGKSRYRIDELQRIMDAAERNPEAVRTYKEWKKEQDERQSRIEETAETKTNGDSGREDVGAGE